MSKLSDSPYERIKSSGHILDHLEAKIVDKQDAIVPRGVCGELCVRGYSVMRSYWQTDSTRDITSDRWYHSG